MPLLKLFSRFVTRFVASFKVSAIASQKGLFSRMTWGYITVRNEKFLISHYRWKQFQEKCGAYTNNNSFLWNQYRMLEKMWEYYKLTLKLRQEKMLKYCGALERGQAFCLIGKVKLHYRMSLEVQWKRKCLYILVEVKESYRGI